MISQRSKYPRPLRSGSSSNELISSLIMPGRRMVIRGKFSAENVPAAENRSVRVAA